MIKLRRCADGKWVFDRGDCIEIINSDKVMKIYKNKFGRYVKQGRARTKIYIEVFEECEK